ncbi:hypothetical protein QE152_g31994 [Popillia japonica]|uniref:Uncharacterized protein n=1 Tax=Popillia japonica TaxID=7064 RepID=A0AAW1J0J1_POPJA
MIDVLKQRGLEFRSSMLPGASAFKIGIPIFHATWSFSFQNCYPHHQLGFFGRLPTAVPSEKSHNHPHHQLGFFGRLPTAVPSEKSHNHHTNSACFLTGARYGSLAFLQSTPSTNDWRFEAKRFRISICPQDRI